MERRKIDVTCTVDNSAIIKRLEPKRPGAICSERFETALQCIATSDSLSSCDSLLG
jgi:hypothetical protein